VFRRHWCTLPAEFVDLGGVDVCDRYFDRFLRACVVALCNVFILAIAIAWTVAARADQETISISFNSDWPPYSFGVGPDVDGILPKLMRAIIEGEMGMRLVVNGNPWTRAQSKVKNGDLDALVTVATKARLNYTVASESTVFKLQMRPVIKVDGPLAEKFNHPITVDDLRTLQVCDLLANGWSKQYFATHQIPYMIANNAEDCLRLISVGRADVIIQPAEVALVLIRKLGMQGEIAPAQIPIAEMDFKLLLSKKVQLPANFMPRFDATMARMRADGSLPTLIQHLAEIDH